MMSVNYGGAEVPLEQAIDDVVRELQQHLNNLQCAMRTASMLDDQSLGDEDDDFREAVKYDDAIQVDIDGMLELFTELKSISKQSLGKPPNPEMKVWYAHHLSQIKEEAKQEKHKQKLEKAELKLKSIDEK